MADELHRLLQAAPVPPPYVLVAHSAGGLNAHLFANTYRAEVEGMVMVDASTPASESRVKPLLPPEAIEQQAKSLQVSPDGWDKASLAQSAEQVSSARPLGNLPLVVLTQGRGDALPWPMSPDATARLYATWRQTQVELAGLSSNAVHVIAPHSGHFIQLDSPALVIAAIEEMVRAARTQTPLRGNTVADAAGGTAR